jgi:hypothetical protein
MNLRRNARVKYLFVLLALLVVEPLRCGGPVPAVPAAQFPSTIIVVEGKTKQGFPFLSGGVSSDERDVMAERRKDYNVILTFAENNSAYLSNVKLIIGDTKEGRSFPSLPTAIGFLFKCRPAVTRSTRHSREKQADQRS